MDTLKYIFPAMFLTGSLTTLPATAASAPSDADAASHWRHQHHRGEGFQHVLSQLNVTADQQTQIDSILVQLRSQMKPLLEAERSNRRLLNAALPTDAAYPALLADVKNGSAARIQQMSNIKTQIYLVLTPAQQSKAQAIIHSEQAAQDSRKTAWRAAHTQS